MLRKDLNIRGKSSNKVAFFSYCLTMPRRTSHDCRSVLNENQKKRIASNGNVLPEQIEEGEILTDSSGFPWRLGKSIGSGGFGEIYLASNLISEVVSSNAQFVVKIERHKNGPLFVEKNFYIQAAKPELIKEWIEETKVKHLGISKYLGSGSHVYQGERYRFLVLERFGQDLGKHFIQDKKRLHLKTVIYIGMQILDALEYIHSRGYVHADIKASNVVLDQTRETQAKVYLIDFGLAIKYRTMDGNHKVFLPDVRFAHAGTLEYTSRDAHLGAYSRRGDLESLGYNLLQWLCEHLPWEECLPNGEAIHEYKTKAMTNVPLLISQCFPDTTPPDVICQYFKYVTSLDFEATPDYEYCRQLLKSGITAAGFVDDGIFEFSVGSSQLIAGKAKKKSSKRGPAEEPENIADIKPRKIVRSNTNRQPCAAQNLNRMTRHTHGASIVLRSQQFNWEKVLLSNPEEKFRKVTRAVVRNEPSFQTHSVVPQQQLQCRSRPTPAMLSIIARQRKRESSGVGAAPRKSRSDSSRSSTPVQEFADLGPLTYAMEEVIRKREEREAQELRSSPEVICINDLNYVTRSTKSGHKLSQRRSARLLGKPMPTMQHYFSTG